jgi:hypothetical protein
VAEVLTAILPKKRYPDREQLRFSNHGESKEDRSMAAAALARSDSPTQEERIGYWDQFTEECRKQIATINATLADHGKSSADCVQCHCGPELRLIRLRYPSTEIKAVLALEHWGSSINVRITGHQTPEFGFYPEEAEFPLARDLNGSVIAIYEEGKSLEARELASYLTQHFRRCFPRISLPCS